MEPQTVNLVKAKEILDNAMDQAQELLNNNQAVNEIITKVQQRVDSIPVLKAALKDAGTTFSMVKDYLTKDYTNVSPKVIATMVSAFIYLIKKQDLISDNIPILGMLDDLAVVGLALKFIQPELESYTTWKQAHPTKEIEDEEEDD